MRGYRGTAKSAREFKMIMLIPYLVKKALPHIAVPYF